MVDEDTKARAKAYPIVELAESLGLEVKHGNKAMCFVGHDAATPSLSFDTRTNLFKCFGCGESGDTIALAQKVKGCTFIEAVEFILGGKQANGPTVPLYAPVRAANGRGEDFADIYECFLKLLPFPDANHYLVKERCLALEVLETNNVKAITKDKIWEYKDGLLKCCPEERLLQSGVLAYSEKKKISYLAFGSCCAVYPFYRNGKIIYLQGQVRPELRGKNGKTKNLRGIEKPSLYFPLDYPENSAVHVVEGIIDTLSILTMQRRAIGILDAGVKDYADFDGLKEFPILLIGDRDQTGFEAKLDIFAALKKKHFYIESISISELCETILGENNLEIKDMNDILKAVKARRPA